MDKIGFIDIHCHLDLIPDVAGAIKNAEKEGVNIILTQGVNPESNRKVLELDSKYPQVKSALGIYPIDALKLSDAEIDTEIAFIRKNRKQVTAIGEVGIDFKEDDKEHERQKEIFKKFILLSQELDLPIIVHSRKAEVECIELLESLNARKVIMHCFCGKWKLVERIQKNGWFITVPTSVASSQQFQSIAKEIPLEQLFCETDSPYLHPEKKWPNEPALVIQSYKKIAELKNISLEIVKKQISENFNRLFG